MFPEEAQAAMAKVLLMVFATVMLCFARARADEMIFVRASTAPISATSSR